MIPREILKKIRQIELRTNRLVTGFAAGARASARFTARTLAATKTNRAFNSIRTLKRRERRAPTALFQPLAEFFGITSAMKNRDDADEMKFHGEIYAVTVKDFDSGFVNGLAREWKSFRVLKNAGKCRVNFGFKPVAQARLLLVMPEDGILKFQPCLRREDYLAGHARRASRRSLSSARTCSHGMPISGLRRSRSARRSNSASCSGDGSSANLARKTWNTSRCSSHGSLRNSSTTSATLMAVIYSVALPPQAEFSSSRIRLCCASARQAMPHASRVL